MEETKYTFNQVMKMLIEVKVKLPVSWYNKYYEDTGEFSLDSERVFKYGFENQYWEESISDRIKRLGLDPYEIIDILENESLIDGTAWPILEEYEQDKQHDIMAENS